MLNEDKLLRMKKEIDEAKTEIQSLNGEKKALLRQLTEDFDCPTLIHAEDKLIFLKNEIDLLQNDISETSDAIENEYFKD